MCFRLVATLNPQTASIPISRIPSRAQEIGSGKVMTMRPTRSLPPLDPAGFSDYSVRDLKKEMLIF